MSMQEKALFKDHFELAFNDANTLLTIAAIRLNKADIYIVDVNQFKQACDDMACLLISFNEYHKLLHFYLWTRNKLTTLFLKQSTGLGVKINCHANTNAIDKHINALCSELAEGKLVPLLRKLTHPAPQKKNI